MSSCCDLTSSFLLSFYILFPCFYDYPILASFERNRRKKLLELEEAKKLKANMSILTAAMKVEFDELSNRMKANFPLRSLTTWLAGNGPLSLNVL